MRRLFLICLLAVMAFCGMAQRASAQSWPNRPVKVIAPFAAGGSADTLGRIATDHLSKTFNQQFYVENRAGGGGLIGAKAVALSEPDGYTFGISAIASHVIAPVLSRTPPFDPLRDFTHVAYLGGPPFLLVVHPSLNVKTYKEFLALAKASDKVINYVSSGAGTHGHLMAEYIARREGLRLNHVPYKGSAPAVMDLVAGQVLVGAMAWSSAVEQVRAGNLVAIGVAAENRIPDFPSVPTFKEAGYPDLVAATWFALSAPANLPADITAAVNREVNRMMDLPDVQKRMALEGVEIKKMTPEEFTALVAAEIARYTPIAKTLGPPAD